MNMNRNQIHAENDVLLITYVRQCVRTTPTQNEDV